jgi:parallel beta-helix repeat protein
VTIALCLNCGKIKIGALCPCPCCGLSSSGDVDLDLLFSDHHLTPESLSQLGQVIGNIRSSTTDDELFSSAVLHFVQLQNPNLLTYDIESSQLKQVKRLLASLNLQPVTLVASETEHQDDEELERRAMNKPERTNEEPDDLILDDDDFLPGAAPAGSISNDRSVDGNEQEQTFQPGSERLYAGQSTDCFADEDIEGETDSDGERLCPRCMRTIDEFKRVQRGSETQFFCPACSESVPFRYVADYDKVTRIKLSLAGMSGHGKTMFLRGIYAYLNSQGRRWPGFSFAPLSDEDARAFANAIGDSSRGAMADPSQLTERPVGFQLKQIPGTGDAHLLFYDISGEAFDSSTKLTKHAFFIPASEVITFVLSVRDISTGHELGFLLARLVDAIRLQGQHTSTKSLIVVLTKGDLLREKYGLPSIAESFLTNEAPADPRSLDDLQRLSDALREWLREHPDNYWNFVESAEKDFANVRYTIISSLGSDPGTDRSHIQVNPRNVISPILWLLRFSLSSITLRLNHRELTFYDLTCACEAAGDSGDDKLELKFSPGKFPVRTTLTMSPNVVLEGAGQGLTHIVLQSGGRLAIKSGGTFAASRITFEAAGYVPGTALLIDGSIISISSCRFHGAFRNESEKTLGHGLLIEGRSTGTISECVFDSNQGSGLMILGQTEVRVLRCKSHHNGIAGLSCASKSSVYAEFNHFKNNKYGFYAYGDSTSEVIRSFCCNNNNSGMFFSGAAKGTADGNTCANEVQSDERGPQQTGILVMGTASVELHRNRCLRNRGDGIQTESEAKAIITENILKDNARCGVSVFERASVTLEANKCHNNDYGIRVEKSSSGTVIKKNESSQNHKNNIEDLRAWKPWTSDWWTR